ncbi:ergothioneine biosynthesis protein EgtC [Sporichthya sp.]|uniref:ergothioneine biosynthesis protein EgtC n=1 Tax=Sporichthya sp. TaxID=65475 RepID=UPI0017A245FC|nr:ergothioneine biosynthesis protein EgtC [Sporichthya sp.]MBA3744547.1 ergothioneine biosynthesis protein EgtC [Sporichthya sp.]
MCRHFAYLGPPAALHDLVFAPPVGLERQSYAPRRQKYGLLNADGFGFGWYVAGSAEPVRYRRAVPLWGEENIRALARVTHSGAVLGAVRSATIGHPVQEGASAPFTAGRWLFSHNGALPDWPQSAAELAAGVPFAALARQGTLTDSTLLWALVLARLEAGEDAVTAMTAVTAQTRDTTGGRVNLLLLDGERIVATTAGDTLCYLQGAHPGADGEPQPAVIVASEPFDDSDAWVDVPDNHVLVATAETTTLEIM